MLCLGGKPNTKYFTMDFRNNRQIVRLVEFEGEKIMKTLDIFLITSLWLVAAWCIYTLIVFLDFIFI
jgi:hypothetical protein